MWSTPPVEFQQYRIETDACGGLVELGRGGMGVTYRAFDRNLQIPVVLKFINPVFFANAAAEARFLREARVAARLRHQNVATVLHLGSEGERRFYAMEFVPGRNLEQVVEQDGPLDAASGREIARQVAHALVVAEQHQLVHRDIKPSNLMVMRDAAGAGSIQVKVIDFGLVKSLDALDDARLTDTGLLGTPHFASPEQLREESVDIRSDFYSLGATLYFAVTGKTLGTGSRAQVMAHHLQPAGGHAMAARSAEVKLDSRSEALVFALLSPRRDDRPKNSQALLALIESANALPHRPFARQSRWRQTVFGLVGVVALAVVWMRMPPRETDPPVASRLVDGDRQLATAGEVIERGRSFFRKYTTADNEYAILLFHRAVELDESSSDAHALLSLAYSQRYLRSGFGERSLTDARREANRAVALKPDSPRALRALGQVSYAANRFAEATVIFERARVIAPDEGATLTSLASCWRERGELGRARAFAADACALSPTDSLTWSIRANIEKKLENDAVALAFYTKARDLSPSTAEPVIGLAHVHYVTRRFAEARKELSAAANITGDEADIECLLAQIELQEGNLTGAAKRLERACSIKRHGNLGYFGQIRYLSLWGWTLLQLGRKDEGARLIEEAIVADQAELGQSRESGYAHYSLAASLFALRRMDEGRARLELALAAGWSDRRSAGMDRRLDEARAKFPELFASIAPR